MNTSRTNIIQLSKILATKMCHDLAGPLGGISNGIEFMGDSIGDENMVKQSLSLLQLSSDEGSAKLQLFRQAYGIINQVGGTTELSILKEAFNDFFKHGKISVEWDKGETTAIDHHSRQILVNLVIICSSYLIMGGMIKIKASDPSSLIIEGTGPQIKKDDVFEKIISGNISIEEITPHNIQIYFTYILAEELGSKLDVTTNEGSITLLAKNLP
jgi:histidine phosphotransferase ChpT